MDVELKNKSGTLDRGIKLNDIDVIGLDNLLNQINEQHKGNMKMSKILSLMPLFIFFIIIVGESVLKLFYNDVQTGNFWETFILCIFFSFMLYLYLKSDYSYDKKDKIEEYNKLIHNNISVINYNISSGSVSVYLDGNESKLVHNIKYCDVDKPVLDLKNKVLKVKFLV